MNQMPVEIPDAIVKWAYPSVQTNSGKGKWLTFKLNQQKPTKKKKKSKDPAVTHCILSAFGSKMKEEHVDKEAAKHKEKDDGKMTQKKKVALLKIHVDKLNAAADNEEKVDDADKDKKKAVPWYHAPDPSAEADADATDEQYEKNWEQFKAEMKKSGG